MSVHARRHARRCAALAALAACLFAWCGAGALRAEEDAHALLKGFQRSGKYILLVDGTKAEKARIFHSRLAASYLILDAGLGSPLLVSPRTRSVQTVPEKMVVEREDGNVYLLADVEPCDVCPFRLVRGQVSFEVEDHKACLAPNPPLLGPLEAQDLLEHTPEYEREGALYEPDEKVIESLRAIDREVDVRVVFGSWCPTCRRYVPLLLRVEEALRDSEIRFRYHGIPPAPAVWSDPVFRSTGLRHVPVVEVRVGDKVLGRFCGNECARPEDMLQRILDS
jgi:thiol-disulfide isomerase/thioredoxin